LSEPLKPEKTIGVTAGAPARLVVDGKIADPNAEFTLRADVLAAVLSANYTGAQQVVDNVNDENRKSQLLTLYAVAAVAKR
jgi:hypothetical protein